MSLIYVKHLIADLPECMRRVVYTSLHSYVADVNRRTHPVAVAVSNTVETKGDHGLQALVGQLHSHR